MPPFDFDRLDAFEQTLYDELAQAFDDAQQTLDTHLDDLYPTDNTEITDPSGLDTLATNELKSNLESTFYDTLNDLSQQTHDYFIEYLAALFLLAIKTYDFTPKTQILTKQIFDEILKTLTEPVTNNTRNAKTKNELKRFFGLTEKQARQLNQFESELINVAQKKTLTLNPATTRFLSITQRNTIKAYLNNPDTLTQPKIDRILNNYKTALRNNRLNTIAITTTTTIINQTTKTIVDAAAYLDLIKPEEIRRYWLTRHDNAVRANHQAIENRYPNGQQLDKPFQTAFGELYTPPAEYGCRCRTIYIQTKPQPPALDD